jgi:hypothetical protein
MLEEQNTAGEHILSEANGSRSRKVVQISAGLKLPAGQVLGELTATPGQFEDYDDAAADGTEVANAVLFGPIDTSITGTNAVTDAVVNVRDTEVTSGRIAASDLALATADLETVGIIVRTSL